MWRRIRKVLTIVVAALILPVTTGTIGVLESADDVYPQRPSRLPQPPSTAPPELVQDRPTVAIVLGTDGANIADTLAPYEVFASTGRFNVVTVAPTPDPVVLTGGLDVLPDLTFAELDDLLPAPPDVIVVPQIPGSTDEIVTWLRSQHQRGAPLIMSVCVGAQLLADAGLLQGRPATSHWLKLIGLRRSNPEVDWTDDVRFVDDGDIITTAGVLSGIDGSLRVIERLVDADTAERTARQLNWNGYRPGGPLTLTPQHPGARDLVALLSAAYRWHKPTTGVLLTDGVGEIELAAAFRPYSELSYLASPEAFSTDGTPTRSRHGLTFLPRSDWHSAAPRLDRILLPAATPGAPAVLPDPDLPVVTLHRPDEFPFDGAFRDIADTYDVATAHWVGKSLQYPASEGTLTGSSWPWVLTATPLLLAMAGVGVLTVLRRALRRRRPTVPSSS